MEGKGNVRIERKGNQRKMEWKERGKMEGNRTPQ